MDNVDQGSGVRRRRDRRGPGGHGRPDTDDRAQQQAEIELDTGESYQASRIERHVVARGVFHLL
jgi:hypothetical protein